MEVRKDVRIVEALAPGGDVHDLKRQLSGRGGGDAVALVGHEPDMGELGGICSRSAGRMRWRSRRRGVACIEVASMAPPLAGEPVWMLTPKILRALAKAQNV